MSDSNQFERFLRNSSWLWIRSKEQAISFIVVWMLFGLSTLYCTFFVDWPEYYSKFQFPENSHYYIKTFKRLFAPEDTQTRQVVLLGGSTSRELTGWNNHYSEAISKNVGYPVKFTNNGWRNQNLAAIWTITEHLIKQRADLIIIGMNYYRFTEDRYNFLSHVSRSSLPVPLSRSMLFNQLSWMNVIPKPEPFKLFGMLKRYQLTGVSRDDKVIKHSPLTESLPIENVFNGPQNFYHPPIFTKDAKQRRVNSFIATRSPQFYFNHRESVQLWIDYLREFADKIKIILLILPSDPLMDQAAPFFAPIFEEALGELHSHGVKIVDWRKMKELESDDFYDQQHLIFTGRAKIFQRFIDMITKNLSPSSLSHSASF